MKIIKNVEISSLLSSGDTYLARGERRIYACGKQLPRADSPSRELLSHWYPHNAKRVYCLNREIEGADRDSFTVCTLLDASSFADCLTRDRDHFYQNDGMIGESSWQEQLREMIREP